MGTDEEDQLGICLLSPGFLTILERWIDSWAHGLAPGHPFGKHSTPEVSMKLHLACRPGMQQGSLGNDYMLGGRGPSQPSPGPPSTSHCLGCGGFPVPGGLPLRAGQSLVWALPTPNLPVAFSLFLDLFPEEPGRKALGRFPGGQILVPPRDGLALGEPGE